MTESAPNPTTESNAGKENQSWLFKIVILPKYLGEAIFKLLGWNDIAESSKFILGFMLIAAFALLILGIISPETLKAFFAFFSNSQSA